MTKNENPLELIKKADPARGVYPGATQANDSSYINIMKEINKVHEFQSPNEKPKGKWIGLAATLAAAVVAVAGVGVLASSAGDDSLVNKPASTVETDGSATGRVPAASGNLDDSICGSDLPEGLLVFPDYEYSEDIGDEYSKSGNSEPESLSVDDAGRLHATFVRGDDKVELTWPAPGRQKQALRGDNADYAHTNGAQEVGLDGSLSGSDDGGFDEQTFGRSGASGFLPFQDSEFTYWFRVESSNSFEGGGCNKVLADSSVGGERIDSRSLTLDGSAAPEVSTVQATIVYSREVEAAPTRVSGCGGTGATPADPDLPENDKLGKQDSQHENPEGALLALLDSRDSLIDSGYLELIESKDKIVYVLLFEEEIEDITDPDVTDFSAEIPGYVIDVENDGTGWSVTRAEFPGC